MKWASTEDIGIALAEKFPGLDPLTVRFTDLRDKGHRARRLRRRSEDVERVEARSHPDGVGTRNGRTRNDRRGRNLPPGYARLLHPLLRRRSS